MGVSTYSDTKNPLRSLYLDDPRPWPVGSSGGKESTMPASFIVKAVIDVHNPRVLSALRAPQALAATVSSLAEAIEQ